METSDSPKCLYEVLGV